MRKALLAAVAALLAVGAACSSDPGAIPEVPDFTPASTTTTEPDYSDVALRAVPGRTPAPAIVVQPGQATLAGVVVGAEGPVGGAKVNIERVVDGRVGQLVVLTLDDGSWRAPGVLGGRYRIRAWRAPDLAQTSPTALFLGQSETKNVELRVRSIGGMSVSASFAPKVPSTTRDTNLVVRIAEKTVSDDGIVRATPLPGLEVTLIGSTGWIVRSSNPDFTDSSGQVNWLLRCREAGRQPLAVSVESQTVPLDVEDCVEPGEATTTTTEPDDVVTPTTTE